LDTILIIVGGILLIIGFLGGILPVIPGPPVSYLGILSLHFTDQYHLSNEVLLWDAGLAVFVMLLDFIIPMIGSKHFGASKYGVWGCGIGALLGAIFFPPFGIILGPFVGGVAGELINGEAMQKAIRAGFGAFLGFLAGTFIKLVASGLMIYHYVAAIVAGS
jgi:uncharacterized protein YqgC (DUF456 family)